MKIAAVYIDHFTLDVQFFQQCMKILSEERAKRVVKLHFAEDQIRSSIGELLVRLCLQEDWGIELHQIQFDYNEFGKPRLRHYPGLHFNISHSGQWVVAAVGESTLGVDVEQIQAIDLEIAERFFSARETEYILCQPPTNRLTAFYRIWTLKESYIKAVGKGLSIPLDSFSFELVGNCVRWNGETTGEQWQFCTFQDLPGYALSICSDRVDIPETIQKMTLSQLQGKLRRNW